MKSFLIAMSLLLAGTFVGVKAEELKPYQKEHYDIVINTWITNTSPENRANADKVYWIMMAHDVKVVQSLTPIAISEYTETFSVEQKDRTQWYRYRVQGIPHPEGSPEKQSMINRIINDVCKDKYTSFQVIAMNGTIIFEYYLNEDAHATDVITVNATSCGVSGI